MPTMHHQDISDTLLLCNIARNVIIKVMRRNADKGEPGRWRSLSLRSILEHAHKHTVGGRKEDIEHALVRLTMVLTKMEESNGQLQDN